jgi:hypothetical protein
VSEFVLIKNTKGGEMALRVANILWVQDWADETVIFYRAHDDLARSDQIVRLASALPARLVVAAIELTRG